MKKWHMKTGRDYVDSIKSLGLEAHILGQKAGNLPEHGLVEPSQRAVAFTYDCAHNPETQALFCVESPLCKDTVNRFTHLHQSTEDLVNKVKMQRYCGIQTGCCFSVAWGSMQPMRSSALPLNVIKSMALYIMNDLRLFGNGSNGKIWWWMEP